MKHQPTEGERAARDLEAGLYRQLVRALQLLEPLFRAEPALLQRPLLAPDGPAFTIGRYVRLRRLRERLFPTGLFQDPAWDILLELYLAHGRGEALSVSAACVSAAVPATTALRYIRVLEERGMVIRKSHHTDRRRTDLVLSLDAMEALAEWEREAMSSAKVRNSAEAMLREEKLAS